MTFPTRKSDGAPTRHRRGGGTRRGLAALAALALLGCEAYGAGEPPRLWPYSPPTPTTVGSVFLPVQGREPEVANLPPPAGMLRPTMPADAATVGVFQGGEDGTVLFIGNNLAREVAVTYRVNGGATETVRIPALQAVPVGSQRPGEIAAVEVLRAE